MARPALETPSGGPIALEKSSAAVLPYSKPESEPAESTRRAYAADFRVFEDWCRGQKRVALPAAIGTVATYLTRLAEDGKKIPTIERTLAGIVYTHKARGHGWQSHRFLQETLDGLRAKLGCMRSHKTPVTDDTLRAMVGTCGTDLRGLRDRAILTVGWTGELRRSEIVALNAADVTFTPQGMTLTLRNGTKTLLFANELALCPVRSLCAWLDSAGITQGPLFRAIARTGHPRAKALSGRSIANLVKIAAGSLGLDPALFSGHSLRAGRSKARSA